MNYLKKRRMNNKGESGFNQVPFKDEDPLAGVANLFDICVVFIVGLILTLFSVYGMQDLFHESSTVTIMKQSQKGEIEIITKEGKRVKTMKVKKDKAKGKGVRLGIAYRLEDGSMVYVPVAGKDFPYPFKPVRKLKISPAFRKETPRLFSSILKLCTNCSISTFGSCLEKYINERPGKVSLNLISIISINCVGRSFCTIQRSTSLPSLVFT